MPRKRKDEGISRLINERLENFEKDEGIFTPIKVQKVVSRLITEGMEDFEKVAQEVFTLDKYHAHEALHMASFLSHAVESELCEHPFIQHHPHLKGLAERAAEALASLYQAIGTLTFNEDSK